MKPIALLAFCGLLGIDLSESLAVQHAAQLTLGAASIPLGQIGAGAVNQYAGDGVAAETTMDCPRLRCAIRRMNAYTTAQGAWTTAVVDGTREAGGSGHEASLTPDFPSPRLLDTSVIRAVSSQRKSRA